MLTTTRDRWVPWLVLAGGFLVGVGWFVGVAWLWSSHTWTSKEKIIATLLVPGGIALPLSVLLISLTTRTSDCTSFGGPGQPTVTHCIGKWLTIPSSSALLLVVLVIVPAIVAVNLEKVRRSRHPLSA
jgi:hypothetical protein